MSRSNDVDIIYEYIVEGRSQKDIGNSYGLSQREVSNILTKNYGFNKGNVSWGTGSANQRGRYPDLSYDEIVDFVNSGSKDIDQWLSGSGNGYNDYDDDDYDDYVAPVNNTYNNTSYNGNYSSPVKNSYGNSYNGNMNHSEKKSNTIKGNYGNKSNSSGGNSLIGILFLAVICLILWGIQKVSAESRYFMEYLKLLISEDYLLVSFAFAMIYVSICIVAGRRTIPDMLRNSKTYYFLALGFAASAVKCYMDLNVLIPSLILSVFGALSAFIGYKVNNRY